MMTLKRRMKARLNRTFPWVSLVCLFSVLFYKIFVDANLQWRSNDIIYHTNITFQLGWKLELRATMTYTLFIIGVPFIFCLFLEGAKTIRERMKRSDKKTKATLTKFLFAFGAILVLVAFAIRVADANAHGDILLAVTNDSFMGFPYTHIIGMLGIFVFMLGMLTDLT